MSNDAIPALGSKTTKESDRLDEETEEKWTLKRSDRQEKRNGKEIKHTKKQETVGLKQTTV